MKINTNELQGPALDWAVAKCEGHTGKWVDDDTHGNHVERPFSPSTDWAQSGPIVEHERIDIYTQYPCVGVSNWYARSKGKILGVGKTPLEAAMRCYVASKLGDEVEIPKELV